MKRDGFLETFEKLGGTVLSNSCGPCIGQWKRADGVKGKADSIVSSFNRGYRKRGRQASLPQVVDKSQALDGRVSIELPVSVAQIIEGVSQEAEQLAGEAGLLIMKAVMDQEVALLAGPKGKHDPDRTATRWTAQPGYVVLAGKKVPVIRPRVRTKEGSEVNVRSYARFQSAPRRQAGIYKKLVNGISTRKYEQAIDDFTEGYGISRSAVSRQMVEAARGALQKLCERRIDELGPLAVLMIDRDFQSDAALSSGFLDPRENMGCGPERREGKSRDYFTV